MKAYGNTRRDNVTCQFGCCHGPRVRGRVYSPCRRIRKSSKTRARREGRRQSTDE